MTRVSDLGGDLGGGVLVTTGNVVMGAGNAAGAATPGASGNGLTTLVSQVGRTFGATGTALQNGGLSATPLVGGTAGGVIARADGALNGVGTVTAANQTVIGSATGGATPALGTSVLSSATTPGTVATVGVLSAGSGATVAALPGSSGTPAITAAVLSPSAAPAATVASAGVLSAGSGVTVAALPGSSGTPAVTAAALSPSAAPAATVASVGMLSGGPATTVTALPSATATASAATGALASTAGSVLNANVGTASIGNQPAILGVGAVTPTTPAGRAASVGVLSGGNALTVKLPGR